MIRKLAAGIYQMLPVGLRVQRKFEQIVRENLDQHQAIELQMPLVLPDELWAESGRLEQYGPELARWNDRHDRGFVLGPTHEEAICEIVRGTVNSYKQLPINLYQIHTKFRDEIRPRFGVMRGREFVMKDAYSFHIDDSSLDTTYQAMLAAYKAIFAASGLQFAVVDADSGNIGGSASQEFMVLADSGEDAIAHCPECAYAANLEKASFAITAQDTTDASTLTLQVVDTPNTKTIAEVSTFLDVDPSTCVKSIVYDSDMGPVMVCIAGDREVELTKLVSQVGTKWIHPMPEQQIEEELGLPVGYIGPQNLPANLTLFVDRTVARIAGGVIGANQPNKHQVNFSSTMYPEHSVVDVARVQEGDCCINCGGTLQILRGIEVGHIFKLGTKYTEAMSVNVLDQNGKQVVPTMGCYGIGITRTVAACIEQNSDERGIQWPLSLAPWHVHILQLDPNDEQSQQYTTDLLELLNEREVLIDDRKERPGVKFADADLLGCPVQIILGKKSIQAGKIEVKNRQTNEKFELSLPDSPTFRGEIENILNSLV